MNNDVLVLVTLKHLIETQHVILNRLIQDDLTKDALDGCLRLKGVLQYNIEEMCGKQEISTLIDNLFYKMCDEKVDKCLL